MSGKVLKVLVIGPVPPEAGGANKGGVAHHVWRLACALRVRGMEVELLRIGRYFERREVQARIRAEGWRRSSYTLVSGARLAVRACRKLNRNLTVRGAIHALVNGVRVAHMKDSLDAFDVIHVHGAYNAVLPLLKECTTKPLVVTVHSYQGVVGLSETDNRYRFFKANVSCADGVINVSRTNAEVGRSSDGVPQNRKYVVYNGVVDTGRSDTSNERCGLVFVGGLLEHKRIDLVVQARRLLRCPDQSLAVVGDGPLKNSLLRSRKACEPLTFYGTLSNQSARRVMAESKVLVVPSTSESFGLVYVEAMMEGTSVIGYGPIVREFQEFLRLDNEERAQVVGLPARAISAAELARTIENVLEARSSPEGRAAMNRISEKAREQFSSDGIAGNIVEVYRDVIKRSTESRGSV